MHWTYALQPARLTPIDAKDKTMSGGWLVEIVVLAMIAGFVALRLVSVLGRRTGHEQPLAHPLDRAPTEGLGRQAAAGDRHGRTEERRGGKEGVSTVCSRGST